LFFLSLFYLTRCNLELTTYNLELNYEKLFILLFVTSAISASAQQVAPLTAKQPDVDMKTFKLYNPSENADSALKVAIKDAKAQGKHVFVQIGGNWCIWCARFNQFVTKDAQIDSLVNANYVVFHMNYSPENKNSNLMAKFGYPQRFGFPVFIVLDSKGKQLHTQNSAYLEQDKGYSKAKVMEFSRIGDPKPLIPLSIKLIDFHSVEYQLRLICCLSNQNPILTVHQ